MKRAKQEFAAEACACGSCRVIPGTGRRTVHFRDRNGHRKSLRLTVRFDRCESCGRSWHLPSHLSAIHESVVAAMGYLPPAELLQRRRLARLTQREVAARARIGLRRVGMLERGLSFPSAEEDARLRGVLGPRTRSRRANAS
jgi:hypothetical protein